MSVGSMALLLKMDEYVETWCSVIEGLHSEIISDDSIFLPITENEEGADYKMSFETRTVLLILAMQMFKRNPMMQKAKTAVEERVTAGVYRAIFQNDDESLAKSLEYYRNRFEMFAEVDVRNGNPEDNEDKKKEIRNDMIGYARYIVSNATAKPETELQDAIQKLSIVLLKAANVFAHFSKNTTLDGNGILFKKYRFYVKR